MVMCWVPGCNHYSERGTCARFFRFPKNKITKQMWLYFCRQFDKEHTPHSTLCSCHFVNGEKANGPTIFGENIGRKKHRKPTKTDLPKALEWHNYCMNNPPVPLDQGVSQKSDVEGMELQIPVITTAPIRRAKHTLCYKDCVDVTLAVEGRYLTAHKIQLAHYSPYFKELFKTSACKHPIIFLKDVSFVIMANLLQYIYQGKVRVRRENFAKFVDTAKSLQIVGFHESDSVKECGVISPERREDKSEEQSEPKRVRLSIPEVILLPKPEPIDREDSSSSTVSASEFWSAEPEIPIPPQPKVEFSDQQELPPVDPLGEISVDIVKTELIQLKAEFEDDCVNITGDSSKRKCAIDRNIDEETGGPEIDAV